MVIDPEGWKSDLAARIDAFGRWKEVAEWTDPLEGEFQRDVVVICALARKVVESGASRDTRLELRKFHPPGNPEADSPLEQQYNLAGRYTWDKSGRYTWGNLIHCHEFQVDWHRGEAGVFFWSEPPADRYGNVAAHLGRNTLQFVTLDELMRSWRDIAGS